MALGSILGGITGAAMGGLATGGAGVAPGYAMGSAIGGGIEGMIQQKKAESMELPAASMLQTQLLEDVRNRRKAMEAGTMYQPQQQNIKQMGTQAMREAVKVAGGNAGATISALQKIQRGTGRSLGELYGQMMGAANQTLALENQMVTDMANRDYQVAAYNKMQQMGDAIQKQKDAQQIMAAVLVQQLKSEGFGDEDIFTQLLEKFPDLFDGATGMASGIGITPPTIANLGANVTMPTSLVQNTQNPLWASVLGLSGNANGLGVTLK